MSSNPGSARASTLLGANLNVTVFARKDMPITPNTKMKQLQWDKLHQQQVSKTFWQEEEHSKEEEMMAKLSNDGIWLEMEDDFKAKQLVINLLGIAVSLCGLSMRRLTLLLFSATEARRIEERS
jgi:cytokinesis protein